jgi:hypothetical protein
VADGLRRRSFILAGLIVLILGFLIVFWPSDERRIRVLFREGIEAVESENIDAVMSRVSFNYRDDHGLTYLTLREWLNNQFQRLTEMDVEEGDLSVSVSGDQATVVLPARVLATEGSMRGYVVGEPKKPARLTFVLSRERSRWLITRCQSADP